MLVGQHVQMGKQKFHFASSKQILSRHLEMRLSHLLQFGTNEVGIGIRVYNDGRGLVGIGFLEQLCLTRHIKILRFEDVATEDAKRNLLRFL